MSQGTGVHLDTRKLVVRMSDILGTEAGEFRDHIIDVKKSFRCQHRIVGFHGMALAHDKQIPVRIVHRLRGDVHLLKVKSDQDVHDAEVAADMSGTGSFDHLKDI